MRSTWVCCLNCWSELEGPQAASDMMDVVCEVAVVYVRKCRYVHRCRNDSSQRKWFARGSKEEWMSGRVWHMSSASTRLLHMLDRGYGQRGISDHVEI